MNLFMMFDNFFFFFTFSYILFFLFFFCNKWIINYKYMIMNLFKMNLIKSFYSLKPKKMNKMMLMLFFFFFFMIFFLNFFGSMPYNFSLTSQMSLVLFFSMTMWLSINLFYFIKNMKMMLSHNIPEGTPAMMVFFLFVIEIISNLIRPLTLSLRLIGNIVAGHIFLMLFFMMIKNFMSFMFILYISYMAVEIFIGFMQAFIMTTLITMYYSDL